MDWSDFGELIGSALDKLAETFGAEKVFWFVVALFVVSTGWRIYQEHRKNREMGLALATKEEALQRAVDESRMWRRSFLRSLDWDNDNIDDLLSGRNDWGNDDDDNNDDED